MNDGLRRVESWFRDFQVRWIDRLQGDLVLPTARTLYLAGAFVALGAVVLGLLAAIWFQLASLRPMPGSPRRPSVGAGPVVMNLAPIDARLSPPTNVRFVRDRELISDSLSEGDVLGHFEAETPNGLASPPDDFQVIGGRDEALFATSEALVRDAGGGSRYGTVLRATAALADLINTDLPILTTQRVRGFELRVLANDTFGVNSPAQTLTVSLVYGPAGAAPPEEQPVETVSTPDTPLTRLAREIALMIDPERTVTYVEAFDRAVAVPASCGAEEAAFVPQYRLAFAHARPKLKAANIEAFYSGLCEAWGASIAERASARARVEQQWAARAAQAQARQFEVSAKRAIARTLRNVALIFVVGALLTFMTIAVLLAFLAIEGHSKAVRQVVELLAARNPQIGPEGNS